MDFSIEFRDITHVVVKTGYAPQLRDLLNIEARLREKTESEITLLYSNGTIWRVGILVPCPFGFRPSPHLLAGEKPNLLVCSAGKDNPEPKTGAPVAKICGEIDRLVAEAGKAGRPFYEQGRKAVEAHRARSERISQSQIVEPSRSDLSRHEAANDLLAEVEEWAAVPRNPDRAMDHQAFLDVADNDETSRDYCVSGEWDLRDEEDGEPLMSYKERLQETRAVIEALGGLGAVEGTLCFKVDSEFGDSAFDIVKILAEEETLRYCAIYCLKGLRLVKAEDRRILVLEYDAEHG